MSGDNQCNWLIKPENRRCPNVVLLDGKCSRHLKQQCTVCFENVRSANSPMTKRLACGHAFHLKCILTWFQESDRCPVCREEQPKSDPLIQFKNNIEDNLRKKYKDVMNSYEDQIETLMAEGIRGRRGRPR